MRIMEISFKSLKGTFQIILVVTLILMASFAKAQLRLGDTIPDVTLLNDNAQPVSLRNLKGKLLLVDFWASWCAPCRKANQKLVKLYKEHQESGFEIVGISVDVDLIKWRKAIAKDKLPYLQLSDPHGFDAHSAALFGFDALPAAYLFNEEGYLVAINPDENQIKLLIHVIKN